VKKVYLRALSLLFLVCLLVNPSLACTTFCLANKDEVLFGRNYDWMIGDALIFVNKRSVIKIATVEESPTPAKWMSKYGSVTFNQYGRELPTGGMNRTCHRTRDLIERSFNGTDFLKSIPAEARDFVAAYPEGFTCGK
jgi:penicillin V acylase-like amidase (Ntn superfamily)